MSPDTSSEHGSISAFMAIIAVALIMVIGLVYDGGQVLATQASAGDLASNAARAGAQEIDLDALRATGTVRLHPERAAATAEAFLAAREASGSASVSGADITVTVTAHAEMRILPLPARTVRVSNTATATPGVLTGDTPDA